MAHQISQPGADGIIRARIDGVMTLSDQRALEDQARRLIDAGRDVSLLVTLEDFEGWEKSEAWSDGMLFQLDYSNEIARIAIVADQRWKESALLFVGKGFRATDIEFFPAGASLAAEDWIRR